MDFVVKFNSIKSNIYVLCIWYEIRYSQARTYNRILFVINLLYYIHNLGIYI